MDKIPSSAGVPPGGGVDGAFERFLTAAIATIITIMFSWRLLSEEEQAAMAQSSPSLSRASIGFQSSSDRNNLNTPHQQIPVRPRNSQVNTSDIDMKDNSDIIEKETTVAIHSQPVNSLDLQATSPFTADDSLIHETSEENSADETLTTWDDYRWEEEDDSTEVIHTRRSVKDFIRSSKVNDTQAQMNENESHLSHMESQTEPQVSSPSSSFTQRLANFEYRDTGGDSGYIDLYPDVESDDSTSDSEHEYEIQVSDSDSSDEERGAAFFGVTPLDTIMEEEPNDSESDDDNNKRTKAAGQSEKMNITSKDYEKLQPRHEQMKMRANTLCNINTSKVQAEQSNMSQPRNSAENTNSSLDVVSKADDMSTLPTKGHLGVSQFGKECDLTVNDTTLTGKRMSSKQVKYSEIQDIDRKNSDCTLIKPEINCETETTANQSPFILHLSKLQNKMKISIQNSDFKEQSKDAEVSDDSLPPSPVRTCALDNLADEAFSDTESCSSESVITVLSVRSADSDHHRNIDIDDICDEPLNTSVISIINNGQMSPSNPPSNQIPAIDSSEQMKYCENIANSQENIASQLILPSYGNSNTLGQNLSYENGLSSSQINGTVNTDSSETCNSVGSSSTDSLISQENNQINTESANLAVNGFDTRRNTERNSNNGHFGHHVSGNENMSRVKSSSSSSDSSDPPLREYDPEDDDLAELHYHPDSDDDSFYLIVGDDQNLRNFETYQNLNSVGLSPEYGDARTSSTVNESAKGFTFSRTEEISTHFRKRTFVTDRSCNTSDSDTRSDEPLSPISSEDEDNRSSENEHDSTEKVIIEFDLSKALHSELSAVELNKGRQSSSTYNDALISDSSLQADKNLSCQTETERKLDLNKYIIQTDKSAETSSELELHESIDPISSDGCNSIEDINSFNSGQIKTCIDPNSLETSYASVKEINNSEYQGETFSELLDKIENLSKANEHSVTLAKEQEQNYLNVLERESFDKPILVSEKTKIDEKVPTEKSKNKESEQTDTFVAKGKGANKDSKESSAINKLETNVDDLWSEEPGIKSVKDVKSRETNVDDIFDCKSTETIPPANSKGLQRPLLQNRASKSSYNKGTTETNVDDLFSDSSEKTQENVSMLSNSKIETNVDDIINEKISYAKVSSQLESLPKENENIKRSEGKANNSLSSGSLTTQIDKSGNESYLSYHSFADDLLRQSSPTNSSNFVSKTRSNEVCSVKNLNFDSIGNKQIGTNIISPEYSDSVTQITKSDTLSINDKKIHGDPYRDKSRITRSNDNTQCKGEASVTNDIENSYIGQSYQTIPQQLRQNPINCSDVSKHSVQINRVSNNESSNVHENYSSSNKENSETIHTEGVVQLARDYQKSVERNSNELLKNYEDKKTNLGSGPTNLDYNANIHVPKIRDNDIDFGVKPSKSNCSEVILDPKSDTERTQNKFSEISSDDIELKIIEQNDSENVNSQPAGIRSDTKRSDTSFESSSLISDTDSLNSFKNSLNSVKFGYDATRQRGHSESALGRVVRTPVVVPSDLKTPRNLYGVKRKIHTTNLKKYTSILQQPVTPERVHVSISTPEKQVPVSRLKISQSRKQFLSEENLSGSFDEKFLHFRNVLVTSTPRKYLKRHERQLTDMQSTESLPADMSGLNTSYGSFRSMDRLSNSLDYAPRRIEELYPPGYDSRSSSFERPDFDKLHKNCMFSPQKLEQIRHTTESLENMFEQLLRYGSVSSLVETHLDSVEPREKHISLDTDIRDYVSFQYPLERAASMSALTGTSDGHRLPRKPGKGRFASRQVPKSKSLQTLETNIDDVFEAENEIGGELKKTPSVHELRVSKSLSKLNVPDWFKKSSFSRSGSTQSLFTYAGRQSSTSTIGSSIYPPSLTTSPSPSVTPSSNAVIIQKRVTPSNTSSTAKLIRAPLLPTTPEKSPIHPTSPFSLPSDKFRKTDKKNLKPIAIVPFAKIREMFERGSSKSGNKTHSKSAVKSPDKETLHKVTFAPVSPSRETVIDEPVFKPVQNHTSASPPPPIPERKPIITERDRVSENAQHNHNSVQHSHQRRAQVHFSDEEDQVSKTQEQNLNSVRKISKPQSMKTSLPMPQFRFRRPAHVKPVPQQQVQSSQSKKGKGCYFHDNYVNAALHALQYRAKIDGEHLFEFLQRRRYSSLLENGFAEQMDDLQDKEVRFNFPVLAIGKHSINGTPRDGSEELQVILTNTCLNTIQNGDLNGMTCRSVSLEEEIEGLLAMKEHRAAMLAMEGNRSIPRFNLSEDDPSSPESPSLVKDVSNHPAFADNNTNVFDNSDLEADYILVTCDNPACKSETNLKEARKFFKTCHSCFSYYCSRSCRKENWEAHKKICIYSRINSACKHVIKAINKDPHMQYQCSRLARRGYLSRGRGCVIFAFPDISSAEDFLYYGMECLWVPPVYVCLKELPNATMLGTKLDLLTQTCNQYNPELKYVIHVAVVIPPKLPSRPVPRKRDSIIQKCAKLRLSPAHMHPKPQDSPPDNPTTMILTAVPGNKHEYDQDGRKTRELCFINIQRKLRQRGVSLRHHYPNVYNRLIDFVSDAKHFSPLIIYPTDIQTGKRFMCVIMPESEPEIEWIRDPDLLHELDIFDEEDLDFEPLEQSPFEFTDTFL